ncbi:hypothetical protein, partial [Cocleimonas flava]
SVGLPHVKVGHHQVIILKARSNERAFFMPAISIKKHSNFTLKTDRFTLMSSIVAWYLYEQIRAD